jgi:hypothetical protein
MYRFDLEALATELHEFGVQTINKHFELRPLEFSILHSPPSMSFKDRKFNCTSQFIVGDRFVSGRDFHGLNEELPHPKVSRH